MSHIISHVNEDLHVLTDQLAETCKQAGLRAEIVAYARVHISAPGADRRLAETVRCARDDQNQLTWWWSWGEPVCPAHEVDEAVRKIANVVTPSIAGI
jgi:hypothetical protein